MSIFMNYEGIKGESADDGHKEWMDIGSVSWGSRRRVTSASSTKSDRESAVATISDLTITRRMDSASPALFIESVCGKGKTVVIHMTKTGDGGGADVYMEYTLRNALVTQYEMDAEAEDDERPEETLTISFTDIETRYTPYDDDGNAMSPIAVGFDTATNKRR